MSNYAYPIQSDWTKDEIVDVINFLTVIEKAYETGVSRMEFSEHYKKFKQVVNSISGEKQLDKQFKDSSGYSIYQVVKVWKQHPEQDRIIISA